MPSSASISRSSRKRSHPFGENLDQELALTATPSSSLAFDEPPTRKARRDILSTQLESLKAELEHERSLRSLDQKRFQQAKQRLQRQVEFAVEETQETKTLMEELRQESEEYANKLRSKYTRLQMEYRDLQTTTEEDRANRADEDAEVDPQVEAWHERYLAQKEEKESLQTTIQSLQDQVRDLQQAALEESPAQPTTTTTVVATPSDIQELHTVKVQVAELERKNRQLKRVNEDLQKKAKEFVQYQEKTRSSNRRLQQLEQTLKERDQSVAMAQAELKSWKEFGVSMGKLLRSEDSSSVSSSTSTNTSNNVPPEVAAVKRFLQDANQKAQEAQTQTKGLQSNLELADDKIQKLEGIIRELEQAQKAAAKEHQDTLRQKEAVERQIQVLEGQETVWQREVESLRSIVKTFDDLPLVGTTKASAGSSDARVRMLQAGLDSAQAELKVLKGGRDSIQKELDAALQQKADLQKTHNTVLEKFGKLREAVYAERAKAEKAEARAVQAEELAGKGAFNPETTRVLHLQQNPLTEALKQEVTVLRRQVQALSGDDSSKKSAGIGSDVDPNKLHQRLKESFKEQIGRFREGVYLMTGFKIDMIPDGERPRFKVRSVFAERENDHLMFQWPQGADVASLDLLDTELAKLLTKTPSYEYVQRFHSIPAFLASTQLSLFEKQTIM